MDELTVGDARARMLASVGAIVEECVALDEVVGRVLTETVSANRDQPPFAASAMDGWAVAGEGPIFTIVGESSAGRGYGQVLRKGQAVRIFTGAPAPRGAERVVIQEEASRAGAQLHALQTPRTSLNIRQRGGDFRRGDVLLAAGSRLDPWLISLAAAAGSSSLSVARRPRVNVLSTGDELVKVGGVAGPDQIYNSNGPTLSALIALWGGVPVTLSPAGDAIESIVQSVAAADGDVLVTLGGASVGDHDLVKPALKTLGLQQMVEGVRIRPGRPTWFGLLPDGRRVLGLPGNPASALVCAELFLKPLLLALQGAAPGPRLVRAHLAKPMSGNGPREHWARARVSLENGLVIAEPMSNQDSSLVSVLAEAGALIRQPAGAAPLDAGDLVDILVLDRI